jgi:hypothetical protein
MTKMGKKRNKAIKMKLPAVKLTDPRVSKEVKKMKQLGDEVLKFVERVEYKSLGDDSVHVQNAR